MVLTRSYSSHVSHIAASMQDQSSTSEASSLQRASSTADESPDPHLFLSRARRRSSELGDLLRGRLKVAGSTPSLGRASPLPELLDPLSQAARELLNTRSIGSDGCAFSSALDEVLAAQEAQDAALRPAAEELYGRQRLHFSGACRNPCRKASGGLVASHFSDEDDAVEPACRIQESSRLSQSTFQQKGR